MVAAGLTAEELALASRAVREWPNDPRGCEIPQAVLEDLIRLIPSMSLAFGELDLLAVQGLRYQEVDPEGAPYAEDDDPDRRRTLYTEERARFHLYGGNAVAVRRRDVVMRFDFYSAQEWRNSRIYVEQVRKHGEWDELICPLPAQPGHVRNLIFLRGPEDGLYSERDRDLLVLLQPHIARVVEQRLVAAVPDLTPTQWQVLRYLDAGMSTREIAEAMFVSPSTVRKHVENVLTRLGVSTRVAALSRALGSRARY